MLGQLHSRTRKAGFTLIELLVVIAIITILAAILFPVFEQARRKAESANCQSNLKQLSIAVHMYCLDNDGRYPLWRYTYPAGSSTVEYWAMPLATYIKNNDIWICPSEHFSSQTNAPIGSSDVSPAPYFGDGVWAATDRIQYTLNGYLDYANTGITEMSIQSPASVFELWDCDPNESLTIFSSQKDNASNGPQPGGYDDVREYFQASSTSDPQAGRHFAGDNYSFIDGHVKWLPRAGVPGSTKSPYNGDPRFLLTNTG